MVEPGDLTPMEVVVEEILQGKLTVDYEASNLAWPQAGQALSPQPNDLDGREVVVGICGGIAAYKAAAVVSTLVHVRLRRHRGHDPSGPPLRHPTHLRGPLRPPRHLNLWDVTDDYDPQHLRLTERADLVLVAPATANILAKMALGLADDLLSTMLLAAPGPVLLAPAMNSRMWENPAVQRNMNLLREAKCHFVGPDSGWMACRTVGVGRMAEPSEIVSRAVRPHHKTRPAPLDPNR